MLLKNLLMKILPVLALTSLLLAPFGVQATTLEVEDNVQNILYIECGSYVDEIWTPITGGSGVVIDSDYVLTNAHVVADMETGYYYTQCRAGLAEEAQETPELTIILNPLYGRYDEYFDYALMEPINAAGGIVSFTSHANFANADSMTLNDYVYVLGYPGIGGTTVTFTEGSVAGFSGTNWIKSNVIIESGNSGGGAFDAYGNFFAIPTAVIEGDYNTLTYLQNVNAILEDMFGTAYVTRDYDNLYSSNNIFCVVDDCYSLADDENADENADIFETIDTEEINEDTTLNADDTLVVDEELDAEAEEVAVIEDEVEVVPEPPAAGRYVPSRYNASLQTRLKGSILLQVEEHGEAWYVNPNDNLRYYMANGDVAYEMMRSFSLGITDIDLNEIPAVDDTDGMNAATSVCAKNTLANRLKGYILLQVQQHGEAWYIDPDTCYRIYMRDGDVAYEIMRYLSLGVTNTDLEQLPSGDLE
jgi:hypothetical protein